MGNCATRSQPQLTQEEILISECLNKIDPTFGNKYTGGIVAAGIESVEALEGAPTKSLIDAGVLNADANRIHAALQSEYDQASCENRVWTPPVTPTERMSHELKQSIPVHEEPNTCLADPDSAQLPASSLPAKEPDDGCASDMTMVSLIGVRAKEGPGKPPWISTGMRELVREYTQRYSRDLQPIDDNSMNQHAKDTLRQLCTNLVVKLDLDLDIKSIDAISSATDLHQFINEEHVIDVDLFLEWFLDNKNGFAPPVSWCVGDESSEDDSDNESEHWLRSGTYCGEMKGKDGKTRHPLLFKVRFPLHPIHAANGKLYERLYNDEMLGYTADGDPMGLYKLTGQVINSDKSVRLIKSYVCPKHRHQALTQTKTRGDLAELSANEFLTMKGQAGDKPGSIVGSYAVSEPFASCKELDSVLTRMGIEREGQFSVHKVTKHTH